LEVEEDGRVGSLPPEMDHPTCPGASTAGRIAEGLREIVPGSLKQKK
jgi:hypothetical protein